MQAGPPHSEFIGLLFAITSVPVGLNVRDWIEQGLTSPPTQCRLSHPGDSFTGQKTQPTTSNNTEGK